MCCSAVAAVLNIVSPSTVSLLSDLDQVGALMSRGVTSRCVVSRCVISRGVTSLHAEQ